MFIRNFDDHHDIKIACTDWSDQVSRLSLVNTKNHWILEFLSKTGLFDSHTSKVVLGKLPRVWNELVNWDLIVISQSQNLTLQPHWTIKKIVLIWFWVYLLSNMRWRSNPACLFKPTILQVNVSVSEVRSNTDFTRPLRSWVTKEHEDSIVSRAHSQTR